MRFTSGGPSTAYSTFRVDALPSPSPAGIEFFRSIGKRAFMVLYDLSDEKTYICIEGSEGLSPSILASNLPGLEVSQAKMPQSAYGEAHMLSLYKAPSAAYDLVNRIISLYYGRSSAIALLFEPENESEVSAFKSEIEGILSNRIVRSTSSILGGAFGSRANMSSQKEIYENSDENMLLKNLLEDIDNSILSGDGVYKTMMSVIDDDHDEIYAFIKDRSIVLSRTDCRGAGPEAMFMCMHKTKPILMGISHASSFLSFHGNARVNYTVTSLPSYSEGNIPLGTYLREGVYDTHIEIKIAESALNLGLVITGLPGSGKTSVAMSIIDRVCKLHGSDKRPKIVIISSTSEWNHFAVAHNLHLIRMYKDRMPINFFSCSEESNRIQFYEDLSVLLANAAKAGPYRNPMEKCFLNAFRRSYRDSSSPDPAGVYDAVEESIIRLHGKRTNAGIRYTKHGENIKSALENLRGILAREEFSAPDWVPLGRVFDEGVVFDVSSVSNSAKPYMYSLILNQVYATANNFDENGDDSLRLVICIEESQILFDSSSRDDTAATEDLSRRIQDFRKRGIALMLITHNAIDIPPQIRRICQNKIYMKQASDTSIMAARDLVFSGADPDLVVLKLNHMNSRMAAMDYVAKSGGEKMAGDSIFIRTMDYSQPKFPASAIDFYEAEKLRFNEAKRGDVEVSLEQCAGKEALAKPEGLSYAQAESFGEVIEEAAISNNRCTFHNMVFGKRYKLNLLNSKGRIIASYMMRADHTAAVCI